MIEVAIAAVEAVFDWKKYLFDTFGYEVDESWMQERASDDETDAEEVFENLDEEAYEEKLEEIKL